MALTPGTGSDGMQTAEATYGSMYDQPTRPARGIIVSTASSNTQPYIVKLNSVNTDDKGMPIPPGKTVVIPAPRGTGFTKAEGKMASGTGSVGWGIIL